ncbi:MAG: SLBB domain-containing protein [Thermovirga sp.]|nr:SLBB domain-containing protein [Thermovirga sp.]
MFLFFMFPSAALSETGSDSSAPNVPSFGGIDMSDVQEPGVVQDGQFSDETETGIPNIFPQQQNKSFQLNQEAQESYQQEKAMEESFSEFQGFIMGSLPEEQLTNIRRFGLDFFRKAPSTFAPADIVPVRPDYVIGPGDEIKIDVWGMVEGQWTVTVSRDGTIMIPRVGVLNVAGLSFEELRETIDRELSKYYSNYQLSVTLGALKNIKVYVVGNTRQPGAYTISSLSTLVNALMAAGGPGSSGTMRDIIVKRNNKEIVHFDMYDFLLKGDKSKDIRLLPEDVIFIPTVGPQVAITGNVKKPAIYELKGETSLKELIEMAGGLTATAFKGRVQVMRISNQEYRLVFEGDLSALSRNSLASLSLKDGDFIRLFPAIERMSFVRVSGALAKPGSFAIEPGKTRLSDVIKRAGGLLYYASNIAEITRVKVTPRGPETERIQVDLKKALEGDPVNDLYLQINDYIFVRTVPNWKLYRTVRVYGEVNYPGIYTIKEGETLSSVLERAGGFTEKAYPRGAIITRESVRKAQQKQIEDMVNRLERELSAINVNEMSSALTPQEAQMLRAESEQKRILLRKLKETRATGRIATFVAEPDKIRNTPYDIELQDGDRIYIPANPTTVQVLGSVLNPSSFVYDKNLSWRDYIRMAGGYTRDANPERIYILKVDGTAVRVKKNYRASAPWVKKFGKEAEWGLLEPGDAIIVPQKLESYRGLRNTRDYIDIIYKLAVTAASIHNISSD